MRSRKHTPGERPSASRIIARATGANIALALAIGLLAGGLALALGKPRTAAGIGCAAGFAAFLHLVSLIDIELIPRWLPRYQGMAFAGSFILKLALFLGFMAVMGHVPWFDQRIFLLAFALAVMLSLFVSSFVVLREQPRRD